MLHLLRPGDPKDASWDGWDAIGSYHPAEDAAIVFAFRTRGENPRRAVPMKGLEAESEYIVRYVDAGRSYQAPGKSIMRDGFGLELDAYADDPRSRCSEVIVLEPREAR